MTEDGGRWVVKLSNCAFYSPAQIDFKSTSSWEKWLKQIETYSFLTGLDHESGEKNDTTRIYYSMRDEAEVIL